MSTFYFLRDKRPIRFCIFFSPNQWMQEVQKLSARFVCPLIIEQTRCFHLIFSRDNAAHRTIQGLGAIKHLNEKYVVARNYYVIITVDDKIEDRTQLVSKNLYNFLGLGQMINELIKHDLLREYDSLKRCRLMASQPTLIRLISLITSPTECSIIMVYNFFILNSSKD